MSCTYGVMEERPVDNLELFPEVWADLASVGTLHLSNFSCYYGQMQYCIPRLKIVINRYKMYFIVDCITEKYK